jgi:2-polyprenyl-6-methoxyphenol hydroxylase-like FAD-dependent oxidoreductase
MAELGLLGAFLQLPHQKAVQLGGKFGDFDFTLADFSHLPTQCKFIALMPQWDFLNFLAKQAAGYPNFRLRMGCEATTLLRENGRVTGLQARTPNGKIEIRTALTIAADGRQSRMRQQAALAVTDRGAPMDVLWFRLPRQPADPEQPLGRFAPGTIMVMINRGDYWQCGFVILKGGLAAVQQRGLEELRQQVVAVAPFLGDRIETLQDWDEIKLLSVQVNYLQQWYQPGFLCIGDAAHAMSPIGGVGINLAIQDAVAAGNILAGPFRNGGIGEDVLRQVQERRLLPTRLTQALQVAAQNFLTRKVLSGSGRLDPPLFLRLVSRYPLLRRLPARLVGMGFRPEHVAEQ